MINKGRIAIPSVDPKQWRQRSRKKDQQPACLAIVTPPPLKKRLKGPIIRLHHQASDSSQEQPRRSIIVEPKRKPNSILAHLLEDITPEEHRR
jgi:hypothetical protein